MPRITGGFSTKNRDDLLDKFDATGIDITLGWSASGFKSTKNPFKKFKTSKVKMKDGQDFNEKWKKKSVDNAFAKV